MYYESEEEYNYAMNAKALAEQEALMMEQMMNDIMITLSILEEKKQEIQDEIDRIKARYYIK